MLQRIIDLLTSGAFPKASGTAVKLLLENGTAALLAYGTTVPTDAGAGYSPGCIFIQTDGVAGTVIYINEGTSASCDFNALDTTAGVAAASAFIAALTATTAELNQAIGDGDEVVTAANVITAAENGKTFYLSLAAGFQSDLPAPALGLRFRFFVKTAPTGAAYVIVTNGGANIMYGHMLERAGGAGVAGAGRDTFNFIHNQSIIGDWVEFWSDGTNWYYHGSVDVAAGNTVGAT